MKNILSIVLTLCAICYGQETLSAHYSSDNPQLTLERNSSSSDAVISDAFANQKSNLQVSASSTVIKLLADDNDGSRHQKFLVRLSSGLTLLIAHNIDLAPRINNLKISDTIEFYGEYEWNEKGGVIHWTHQDPRGAHPAGWLKHKGQKYR
jgi:hypothetical protein